MKIEKVLWYDLVCPHCGSKITLTADEYEKYKEQLDRSKTKYVILSERVNDDGSIIIEIKKQYNTSPVGDYLS